MCYLTRAPLQQIILFLVQYKYKAMHIWDTIGSGSSPIGVRGQDYTELAHMTEVANQSTPLVAYMVHYPMSE